MNDGNEREKEGEQKGEASGTLCSSRFRNAALRFSLATENSSLSLSLYLYHARREEATAAKLRRGEVGPGEHGHGYWCERECGGVESSSKGKRRLMETSLEERNLLLLLFFASCKHLSSSPHTPSGTLRPLLVPQICGHTFSLVAECSEQRRQVRGRGGIRAATTTPGDRRRRPPQRRRRPPLPPTPTPPPLPRPLPSWNSSSSSSNIATSTPWASARPRSRTQPPL